MNDKLKTYIGFAIKSGKYNRGTDAVKMYKKLHENACRYAHLGDCYLGLGEYEKALTHLNTAISMADECAACPPRFCHEAYFSMCRYYDEKGELDKALECLVTAIKGANAVEYNKYKKALVKRMS